MSTITSANAILMLSINNLFSAPQQLQGFAAEDIFDVDDIETAETLMGVDGKLSAGFVFVPVKQGFMLQADSDSITLFEAWYAAEKAVKDKYFANGVAHFNSIGRSYVMTNGVLSGYKPMADGKKVLQPRKFSITWESVVGVPV